jgi:hypothetical protein
MRRFHPIFRSSAHRSLVLSATALATSSCWAITPPCELNKLVAVNSGAATSFSLIPCSKQKAQMQLASFEPPSAAREAIFAESLAHAATSSSLSAPAPASLFAEEKIASTITSSTKLRTTENILVQDQNSYSNASHAAQIKVSADTIEKSAGTFGDPSRYFQLLPGVITDNDQRNDMLVRGGNPVENLFVIDGIVVPSINHLALSDTTGGFVSMIDNNAIESLTLHSGVHDAHFQDRLSSVIEINTVPESSKPTRRIFEAGFAGIGVTTSKPWGNNGNLLVSGRESVLNLLTNDIGLNGVPRYTNSLVRADRNFGERDRLWGLSLTGIDSIAIRPDPNDPHETNPFNINYSGWRNTSGMNWQHVFSAKTFGLLTVSNAEQAQNIHEYDQSLNNETTYVENSHEGTSTASYTLTSELEPWLLASGGITHSLNRIDYNIQQPVPLPNPYSADPTSPTATSILQQFHTNVDSAFAQATIALVGDATLTLSGRADHWDYGDHTSLTPRALFSVPVYSHRMGIGYAEYTQMPSYLYLLAFSANHSLAPIKAEHTTFDLDLLRRDRASLTFSAYRKLYMNYPVPSAYPSLSLANVADTFGQSFLIFPLISAGHGRTEGVELNLESQPTPRLHINASASYARAWYSGLDGVLRRGNYDIPLTANLVSLMKLGKNYTLSMRYSGASGRPYTPDDLVASTAQDRDVYNLTRINLDRSGIYGRLDVRVEQKRQLGAGTLTWNVGLLNVLGQKNFYSYLWQTRPKWSGGYYPPSEQDQLPRFPEGSIKYTF